MKIKLAFGKYTITLNRVMSLSKSTCPAKPSLADRPLMCAEESARLADVFGVLASTTRLRLLHALERKGEFSPTALADAVGMKVQAVSNQLQLLAVRGIVSSRRDGNSVFYRLDDPCIAILLDRGWCLAEDAALRNK